MALRYRPPMSNATRLLVYLKPQRRLLARASLYSIVNKLFDIAPELLIGVAVDVVVKREQSFLSTLGIEALEHQLAGLAILSILIWGFESLFQFLYQLEWRNIAQVVQHEIRLNTFSKVLHLNMGELDNKRLGDLSTVLSEDVNQLERFLNNGINSIIQVMVSTFAVGAIFFFLAPKVAVFSMMPIPIILLLAFFFQKRLAKNYESVRSKGGILGATVTGFLGGIATLKAFSAETHAQESLARASHDYQEANRKAILWSSAFVPIVRMAVLAGFVVTLWYGGHRCIAGALSVGAYSVLVFLTQRLLWPFTRLGETVDLYQRSMASAGRLLDILALEQESTLGRNVDIDTFAQDICFQNVSFSYREGIPVLKNLTLKISAGKTTAFVGTTGSGKSTILKLLLGFYKPQSGTIRLGDLSTEDININHLRSNIAWVGQDAEVFFGSIDDNLKIGQKSVKRENHQRATRASELDRVAQSLPEGYDTQVGEGGGQLSGGQRQRLAIARALIKDSSILLMDEATSAIDNETEAAIQRALKATTKLRTTIVVAHRLSTIRDADLIHVMSAGKIIESGSHDVLLKKKGSYAKLWKLQTGEASHHSSL